MPFENGRTNTKVFNTAVVAGTKECFIDLNSTCFFCRNNIIYKIWFSHYRTYFTQIKGIFSYIFCIRIAVKYSFWLTSVLFKVFHCLFVSFKDTCLCTGLYCHIAESHTITDA